MSALTFYPLESDGRTMTAPPHTVATTGPGEHHPGLTPEQLQQILGQLDEFRRIYDGQHGAGAWERQKHKEEPGLDRASAALHELEPKTYRTAEQWAMTPKSSLLTAKTFPARAAQLVDRRRGKDRPIVFVADEVGHFVSRSSDRMQDVQGIVEARAVLVLGRRTIFVNEWTPEIPKLVLLLATLALLLKFKKLPEPIIILGAAIVGFVLYPMVHP